MLVGYFLKPTNGIWVAFFMIADGTHPSRLRSYPMRSNRWIDPRGVGGLFGLCVY